MKISELIIFLEQVKKEEGDINICIAETHEYWGSVEHYLDTMDISIKEASPKGVKSWERERCVVINY